ncbi:hypothetical protein SAMN04489806_0171 [Paramicrobacterium humi]|uniref:Spermatogenesis-associated protein 20-like TRX domain-containing protein n=1 Tax=Paramicrobacterium humi TaxID=640635 RepID=A0A1H4ITA7_9MICO|nr:thioredoxin domain-containing protein [Microbacterium humi]SEB36452.1 hypothetical protein SAMN04489806_0171 [Microbacterium humi]
MPNRLAGAMSPYLRAHAANPVDWHEWGEEAFAEATERDVPVFVSIGYATCHWCHVMARESFSDPELAGYLDANFVSVKVDREEHPGVDASYMAQAAAFTQGLGWPLSVFATADGAAFFAGTYFPPQPVAGRPSFRQVLEAVVDAWRNRRDEVRGSAAAIGEAVRSAGQAALADTPLPGREQLAASADALARHEDAAFGGFGAAPKFPVAPALGFLQAIDRGELATRTLLAMARSPLRDTIEGGFFRYATQRDWSEPHYERMLYDNALLLSAYTRAWQDGADEAAEVAAGIASFLLEVLQLPGGGFASGQDSESLVDGVRTEGGYYLAADRTDVEPPPLDEKVLTGWNGLAIEALARAGTAFAQPHWIDAARWAADYLLENHLRGDGTLLRASTAEARSDAAAALEDYGMLAGGLLELGCATGDEPYVRVVRRLLQSVMTDAGFAEPAADPVLASRGLVLEGDPSEGAYPSGLSASARAARRLYLLTGDAALREHAERALAPFAERALQNPVAFGALLEELTRLASPARQLVVVLPDAADGAVPERVRRTPADLVLVVRESAARQLAASGIDLLEGRTAVDGEPTLYDCADFTCRLPETLAG